MSSPKFRALFTVALLVVAVLGAAACSKSESHAWHKGDRSSSSSRH